jgi:flagellar basal-body rod protein FlgC
MRAMEISRTGLDVEWRRLEVIAENLANVNTVGTAAGSIFQPLTLVSGPRGSFSTHLEKDDAAGRTPKLGGVMVYGVEAMTTPPRIVHEPDHPQADANGDVAYPGVNHAQQMTLMVKTARAYQANLVALSSAREMYSSALQIGDRR